MTLVGTYADTSPAWVSMMGRAVSEPLPYFSPTRRPLQHERHLPVGHGVLGEVVIDDQRVHAVVHEPLAHRRTGKRHEILVGGRIRGGGRHDDRVGHRAGFFENGNYPGHAGLLLT